MSRHLCLHIVGLLALAVALFAVGCGGNGTGQLRVLHAAPNEPSLTVVIDGTSQTNALDYAANTGYITVQGGSRHLQLEAVNTTAPIVDQQITVPSSGSETVIFYGLQPNLQTLALTDQNTAPTAGTAAVRLVNVAPSMGPADVYIVPQGTSLAGATPTVSALAFGSVSTYQPLTITAGTTASYDIFFTQPGSTLAFLNAGPVNITSGQVRTVVALNNLGGGFTSAFLADLD
jgi:hypothetical protein